MASAQGSQHGTQRDTDPVFILGSQAQGAPPAQERPRGPGEAVFVLGNTNDVLPSTNDNLEFSGSSSNLIPGSGRPIRFFGTVGDSAGPLSGSFPGATPQSNAGQFSVPFPGTVPQPNNLLVAQRQFFQRFQRPNGLDPQDGIFQAQSLGDSSLSGRFPTGQVFPSFGSASSGSRRVIEARPDVTLTRTVTLDRFVTTTEVAFVEEPRTATIFSLLTHTAVTTVVRVNGVFSNLSLVNSFIYF